MKLTWTVLFIVLSLAGCGSMNAALNESTQVSEYYRVFDVRTDVPVATMIAATREGLARNTTNISDYRPVMTSATVPETPGRFTVVNPLQNSNLSSLVGAQANLMRRAQCDGAVWIANATRGGGSVVRDSFATLSVCLWHYTKGYHIDLYANLSEQKGGIGVGDAARALAHSLVGTPQAWIEATFDAIPRQVQKETSGTIALVTADPPPKGEPWLCSAAGGGC